MNFLRAAVLALLFCLAASAPASAASPRAWAATTCSDYNTQADAQRGADTRDPDGDGVYCESLPCPCLKPGSGGGDGSDDADRRVAERRKAAAKRRAAARRRAARRISKARRRIEAAPARIVSVTDGDTVNVRVGGSLNKTYKVRVLGVDTPESRKPGTPVECGAREATSAAYFLGFTGATDSNGDGLLDTKGGTGVKVSLQTDRSQDLFDGFKRLLAYVDVAAGARGAGFPRYDFGRSIISEGYSRAYTFKKRVKRYGSYKSAETAARSAGKGVWSLCGGNFHSAN